MTPWTKLNCLNYDLSTMPPFRDYYLGGNDDCDGGSFGSPTMSCAGDDGGCDCDGDGSHWCHHWYY